MLLVGAVVFELGVGSGPLGFYWTPLGLGVVYLACAAVGGRGGGHWATAVPLVGWGAGVVLAEGRVFDVTLPVAFVVGMGSACGVVALLRAHGFPIAWTAVAATIVAAGLLFSLEAAWPRVLGRAATYAALLALVGVVNLALAVRATWQPPRNELASPQ